jgi:DNA-binding transcriptional LysR family regulator
VLLTERRWVVLPAAHPLAACNQISFHQLRDEPFVAAPAETGWWRDYRLGGRGDQHAILNCVHSCARGR